MSEMNYPRYTASEIYENFSEVKKFRTPSADSIPDEFPRVEIVGELVSWRAYGKTAYGYLQDDRGTIQIYVRSDKFDVYSDFRGNEKLGDTFQVRGAVYRTQYHWSESGILTIFVESILKEDSNEKRNDDCD